MKKIKLIANPNKPWAAEVAREAKAMMVSEGFLIVENGADVSICIGGDGTILYANHDGKLEGTVLGIGSGSSYICQLTRENWKGKIIKMIRNGKTEKRQMLRAECSGKTYSAINDFVIHSKDYRVIWMDMKVDGTPYRFEGDGIIVTSATGSSAYAYSAGGKKMNPTSKKIQTVPICPYLREFKPTVLSQDSVVELNAERESGFIVDGVFIKDISAQDKVTIGNGDTLSFFCKG
jgi:NAD+ kinase